MYEPDLLSDQSSTSAGGTTAGSSGQSPGGSNSAGSAIDSGNRGGDTGNGGSVDIGAAGVGGLDAAGGEPGGNASGGAAAAADGGATVCVSETVAEFCKRVGKNCGALAGTDNCGNAVKANCGTCQGFKRCGGGVQVNVCGALTDPASGGIATASSVGSIGENGTKAFDANVNSKWFSGDGNNTGWLAYQFPGNTSYVVTSYSITSANDVPERDPLDWQLQGSNDGSKWLTVDQRSGQVFATRLQTSSYTCSASIAYRWFRLLITANGGANDLQLAELVLYGD